MRPSDLDLRNLLDFRPEGGVLRFGGQRTLLLDATALGLLRRELVEALGETVARGILTRLGFTHGQRTAEAARTAFPWESEHDWSSAGMRFHTLQGMVIVEPLDVQTAEGRPAFARSIWRESFEAQQHLLFFGPARQPSCWMLAGFASGYVSYCRRQEIYFVEEKCLSCGDTNCQVIARTKAEWGAYAESFLPDYRRDQLDGVLDEVARAIKNAERELEERRRACDALSRSVEPSAKSPEMRRAVDLAARVAAVDTTVLIAGESGVGKERIARLIHQESPRRGKPFVAVNCGAVTESLLESELFGHAKGAFSGAVSDRLGLFEAAQSGTLLLDEIGEISQAMQVKLLRVLQEREVRRVGENKNRPIDVRILAATHRDLAAEVEAGRFRADLYYRLRVVEIRVPPLRERREDVLELAHTLLRRLASRLGCPVTGFTHRAAAKLISYPWPGNVRELENAIERATVLATGNQIDLDLLPDEIANRVDDGLRSPRGALALKDVERQHILWVLKANGGNRTVTAAQLKIGSATLYRKLKEYGME